MKKTILITGGLGYIGSHAVVAFEQSGYETIIVDNLSNSSIQTLENIECILGYRPVFYKASIQDKDLLEEIFTRHSFEGVIHFAGLKAVGESCNSPFLYYENNIQGSLTLFEKMESHGIKNIVFSSSATVYDQKNTPPFKEEMQLETTNPYGTTKLVIEKILADLSKTKQWNVISLRYFNPIGVHLSGLIGENPQGIPNNLLPFIFDVVQGKRECVGIFGNDYNTHDGTGVRDYIDVNDLIEAHVLAYKKLKHEIVGWKAINIGTGKGSSVLDMIKLVEEVTGKKVPYTILPRRDGDVAESVANASLAEEFLGWSTKTSLKTSISNGWKFIG